MDFGVELQTERTFLAGKDPVIVVVGFGYGLMFGKGERVFLNYKS